MKLNDGFELLITAPDGVLRLRDLILSLAVMGRLVPQDPNDAPASELLKQICVEKDRLIAKGKIKIKRDKTVAPIEDDEKPFWLPTGWEWTRLSDIAVQITDGAHHTPQYTPHGVPFLSVKDISSGQLDFSDTRFISEEAHADLSKRCNPEVGDILLTKIGTTGVAVVVDDDRPFSLFVSVALIKLPAAVIESDFLSLLINSPHVRRQSADGTEGVGNKNLVLKKINRFVLPLPPLPEQRRIVARVDELMRLCDELQVRGRLEGEQHAQLTATLFDALAASESSHALAENWARVAANFDLLLDRPEAVDALEQTVLQLAVRGLLVQQDANDEPASVLLEQAQTARDELLKQGRIGRSPAPAETDDVPPAMGWESVTLPDLCVIGGGATPSKSKAAYWEGTLPWVSPKDMKVEFIADAQDHVSELALKETRLPLVPAKSLLIVVRGMILAHSFPVGITQVEVTINQDMKSLTPLVPALVPYVALVCRGFKHEILELVDRSTHGTCKLQSDKLFAFRFGLPPLAEQSRILARVEEMRQLCDGLRERLTARQNCQTQFAEAMVGQAASTAPLVAHTDALAAAA
jgi:type I restriction enzyme S subunit